MTLSIVKISNLPLGKRILRHGCNGRDVMELQNLLYRAGFYFGRRDGEFGLLTEEAVILLQRTFHLKIDGAAGREVIWLLNKISGKTGRIIYTVKKNEALNNICQRFAVKKTAWKRIPGQGNPHKKLYPGLKMLLHEMAFFSWDDADIEPYPIPLTGRLSSDYQIERNGEVKPLNGETTITQNRYHLIGAGREIWTEILSSGKIWLKLIVELKKLKLNKFGFDLREAPMDQIVRSVEFLKFVCRNLKLKELKLLALPLIPQEKSLRNRLFWRKLPVISASARLIVMEPVYNLDTPQLFESSANQVLEALGCLAKLGLADKTLLTCQVAGWDWNLAQNRRQKLAYRVAGLLRAQYSSSNRYSAISGFNILYYHKHQEDHCLIYRDEKGWLDFLERIIQLNLAGIVISGFKDLGRTGPEIIAGSFKVLPMEALESS